MNIEREVDRHLTLLRQKIREQGFSQLKVQETLGWGRSYISQLITKQKALRFDQVEAILGVIGVETKDFFAELYPPQRGAQRRAAPDLSAVERDKLGPMLALLKGTCNVLIQKRVIGYHEIMAAKKEVEREMSLDHAHAVRIPKES